MKIQTKKIDLSNRSSNTAFWARLCFQTYFDFYREIGGNLDSLDNLLCDYEIVKKRIKETLSHFWIDRSKKVLIHAFIIWPNSGGTASLFLDEAGVICDEGKYEVHIYYCEDCSFEIVMVER